MKWAYKVEFEYQESEDDRTDVLTLATKHAENIRVNYPFFRPVQHLADEFDKVAQDARGSQKPTKYVVVDYDEVMAKLYDYCDKFAIWYYFTGKATS